MRDYVQKSIQSEEETAEKNANALQDALQERIYTDKDLREFLTLHGMTNLHVIPSADIEVGEQINEGASALVHKYAILLPLEHL